ncbi:hypothetical protein [Rhabdothermincola sp.]|uniref:hypothetical protein n=1 Tax=Rhabdothermincola sp. TaxID=2820405 RepID=UPI002FE0DCFB
MSTMQQQPARTRRSFTDGLKRDAVTMAFDEGQRIVDVTRQLWVGDGTLGNRVRQERVNRGVRAGWTI